MRKVTQKASEAMKNGENMVSGNTRVHSNGGVMDLHNNTIAIYDRLEGKLTLRDCGWQTVTTKERLNGILATLELPYGIFQKNGQWILATYGDDGLATKNELWDGFKVFEVKA